MAVDNPRARVYVRRKWFYKRFAIRNFILNENEIFRRL